MENCFKAKGGKKERGFTIVELIIVLAVIAALCAVLFPVFSGVMDSAKKSAAMQECMSEWSNYVRQLALKNHNFKNSTYIIGYADGEENYSAYFLALDGQFLTDVYADETSLDEKLEEYNPNDNFINYTKVSSTSYQYSNTNVTIFSAKSSDGTGGGSGVAVETSEKILKFEAASGGYTVTGFLDDNSTANLIIPSEYNGLPVVSIGDNAFKQSDIVSVSIPDSVTSIGVNAFCYSLSLESVIVSDSVTTIGNYAFAGCSSLSAVTLGKSVTKIGDGAFNNCEILKSIIIPASVTEIGCYVFNYCDKLTSITFECTSGWYKTTGNSAGTAFTVDSPTENAQNMKSTNYKYYRKD